MKNRIILILAIIFVLSLSFAYGCKEEETHVHSWSQTQVYDQDFHWQKCESCDEIREKTEHEYTLPKSDDVYQWLECECGASSEKTLIEKQPSIAKVIKFDSSAVSMLVGESLDLRASKDFSANFDITYASDNPNVLSVDQNGKATALSKGKAKVTASYKDVSVCCEVTVTHGEFLPLLKTDSLNDEYTLMQQDTLEIKPYVLFNGKAFYNVKLSYEIDGSSATCSKKGNALMLTGISKGQSELTITAEWDGFAGLSTLIKSLKINVESNFNVYVNGGSSSSITIYNQSLTTIKGQTSTSAPLLITTSAQSASTVVTVENPEIATFNAQTCEIQATGKTGQTTITIKVTDTVGNEHIKSIPLCCYPAVGDYLNEDASGYVSVEVDTISGQLPLEQIFGEQATLSSAYLGRTPLTVNDNKIVDGLLGDAFNTPQPVVVTLYIEDFGMNVEIIPYLYKQTEILSQDYQYSCETGEFFDQDFVLTDVGESLGKERLTQAYLQTEDGQKQLTVENGKIVDLQIDASPEKYFLALVYGDKAIKVGVTAYTLIIDQMQDFKYFTVYEGDWTYHRAFMWNIASDVMEWDGYYVLANDIDATTYDHKGLEAPYYHLSWDNVSIIPATFETGGAIYACVDDKDAYGLFGKGLLGTFDGRGHVIDGYKPNSGGLFQALNGGYIKDLGFTNTRLSPTTGILSGIAIKNTVIDNVFVHVDPNYSYGAGEHTSVLTSSVSRRVTFRNIVVINQTTNKSSNSSSILGGQDYCSAYGNNNSNVHVISSLPIFFKYSASTEKITTLYEASYIDGEKVEITADSNIQNLTSGVYRWNTAEIFKENLPSIKEQAFGINAWLWDMVDKTL